MADSNDQLRTKLSRKFQPPIDVLLDPSLLAATRSLERLTQSSIFESQTQATLTGTPTEPRLGDVFVPATFRKLVANEEQSTVQQTEVWDFYCQQAESALRDELIGALDENSVETFSDDTTDEDFAWMNAIDDPARQEDLLSILKEELSFLLSGGIILSRTARTFEILRDAGVLTIDIGQAKLTPEVEESLTDVGYGNPASNCAFCISAVEPTTDALAGNVLADNSDVLLYHLGG